MSEALPAIQDIEVVGRLALAGALGAAVGLEREWRDRTAGLRTHMLVCIGSTVFTILSAYGWREWHGVADANIIMDPSRVAAQIVSGIGFLGAGAILRGSGSVRGLTTAASLWIMAAIGMAVGAGEYVVATAATIVIIFVLTVLRRLSRRIHGAHGDQRLELTVRVLDEAGFRSVFDVLNDHAVPVRGVRTESPSESAVRHLSIDIDVPNKVPIGVLLGDVTAIQGVVEAATDIGE